MEKRGYKLVTFEQSISDYKNDIAEIMQQSQERREAFLSEKFEKLYEGIVSVKEVRSKFEPVNGGRR